jgi:hypothetical protein
MTHYWRNPRNEHPGRDQTKTLFRRTLGIYLGRVVDLFDGVCDVAEVEVPALRSNVLFRIVGIRPDRRVEKHTSICGNISSKGAVHLEAECLIPANGEGSV